MKIVFLDTDTMGNDISLDPISAMGTLVCYGNTSAAQIKERVADCDVLIVNKIKVTKEVIDAAPSLKLVCVAATGVNNIDVEYAAQKGIPVKNVVDYSTESVAQVTLMQMLSLVGRSRFFDDYVKNGDYSRGSIFTEVVHPFYELRGKRLGIIGLGNIGRRVASLAEAFGMEVVYYSASGNPHSDRYRCVSLEELLSESDIVSIHAPLTEKTNNLITYPRIAMMKRDGYLLNAGRGGIVNEKDLAKALDDGLIEAAAIDVFAHEPIPADHPYLTMKHPERILLSPHIAWASREARTLLVKKIAENIGDTFGCRSAADCK